MQLIKTLGYLVLGTRDLSAWTGFATDILGMQVGWRDEGRSVGLRMDERQHRLILDSAVDDELTVFGWELDSEEDLGHLAAKLRAHGVRVDQGDAELAARRGVAALCSCADPVNGYRHEFVCGPQVLDASKTFRSQVLKGSFRTGELGVGHVALTSVDYPTSLAFYRGALGLRVSAYGKGQLAPGVPLDGAFLYAAAGRHHSIAVLAGRHPKPTRHVMVEYTEMDDVGMALDRCLRAGVAIDRTLGIHEGDRMFSFYAVSPSGLPVEIGWGGRVDTHWQPVTISALSEWGHVKQVRPA